MTEPEWLACTDPMLMLKYLRRKVSDRKMRLFACGCCRRIWGDLTLKPVRQAVETAESYADGSVSDPELKQAHDKGISVITRTFHRNMAKMVNDAAFVMKMYRMALAVNTAHAAPFQIGQLDRLGEDQFLKAFSPALLRCVIGSPFHPLPPKWGKRQWSQKLCAWRTWNDGTIPKLAQAIYDDRTFDRLPILADALEEAGCTNPDILAHCRSGGDHVRGCWVVDLVLGKS
jgi:hypothetical protein